MLFTWGTFLGPTQDLYAHTCIAPATTTLLRSHLCVIGHALRRTEVPFATFLNPQNQPSERFWQGWSLRCTYILQLIDDLNAIGLQHDQAVRAAQDWPGWQRRNSNIEKNMWSQCLEPTSARVASLDVMFCFCFALGPDTIYQNPQICYTAMAFYNHKNW